MENLLVSQEADPKVCVWQPGHCRAQIPVLWDTCHCG